MPEKNDIMVQLLRIGLSILGVFFFSLSFGQLADGYIIKLNGDTLQGSIQVEISHDQVSFKPGPHDELVNYTPLEIKGFGVDNKDFVSATIEKETSSKYLNNLTYGSELTFEDKTTFLQVVETGTKKLFFYSDVYDKNQFYIEQDGKYVLLINKKYLKEHEGQTVTIENKTYIGQLTVYFSDCPALNPIINKTEYNRRSLGDLFESYYFLTGIDYTSRRERIDLTHLFGVLAGLSTTDFINYGNEPSTKITFGISYDLVFKYYKGKISLSNNLLYTSHEYDYSWNSYTNENDYNNGTVHEAESYLRLQNIIKLAYPIGKMFITAGGGLASGMMLSSKAIIQSEKKQYGPPVFENVTLNDSFGELELGYVFGGGLEFKKFSLEFKYEKNLGNNYNQRRKYILLGYTF